MKIAIQQAAKADAPLLADFIMEAMSAECCAYFYGNSFHADAFRQILIQLAARANTQYSYLNSLTAIVEGQIVGTLISYDGAMLHSLRQPFLEALWKQFRRDFSNITDETNAGELYIDSLAVLPNWRHLGIATLLLHAVEDKATSLNIPRTGLLVDTTNPQAEKLYRSLGYQDTYQCIWAGHKFLHMQKHV